MSVDSEMNLASNTSIPSVRCVVMGVSGVGKSEIGKKLGLRLGIPFVEGDEFHPSDNVSKMAAGTPLDDADRHGWLQLLQNRIAASRDHDESLVLSCSSLKRRYRDFLRQGDPGLIFIHLVGDANLIALRMQARTNHFMPFNLLESQFRDLEPLQSDERGIAVDVEKTPKMIVDDVLTMFASM